MTHCNRIEMSEEDCCDLAAHILNISDQTDDELVWLELDNQYGVEPPEFIKLITKLVPLIDVGKSPLTGKMSKGFAEKLGDTDVLVWFAIMELNTGGESK